MKRALLAFTLVIAVSAQSSPVALFNGRDLGGWQSQGDMAWSVVDGALVASGSGDGFLVSDGVYGDLRLVVEFWVDATTNAGVFIRCRDRARIHPQTCYELNIWDAHPQQEARTGAIVQHAMPPLARVDTAGRWSVMQVVAKGASIEVKVNGVVTARLANADPTPGAIALQHWGNGTVKYRNVEIGPR